MRFTKYPSNATVRGVKFLTVRYRRIERRSVFLLSIAVRRETQLMIADAFTIFSYMRLK